METYTNPLTTSSCPDPYVMEFQGTYYCYCTGSDGVYMYRSDDLVHWDGRTIVYRSETERDYWAPSVIWMNGVFHLYYSSISHGQEEECLKVATASTPEGPFAFVKQFFPWFSIDSQPVLWEGRLYMFYSTNTMTGTADDRPGTGIIIDLMDSPFSFSGHPRLAVRPTMDEEIFQKNRFGDGRDWHTIEGASFLSYGKRLFLMYSANAYVHETYYVGFATGAARHDLRDVVWTKYPDEHTFHALLQRNQWVEGTGHNCIVKAPNMIDDWIVYHGRNRDIPRDPSIEQRVMRIDRIFQDGDIIVCDGPSHMARTVPGQPDIVQRQNIVENRKESCIPTEIATSRIWMRPKPSHMGSVYGLFFCNYYLRCTVGSEYLTLYTIFGGILRKEQEIQLPPSFDHYQPHAWMVIRCFGWWTIQLDDTTILHDRLFGEKEGGVFSRNSILVIDELRTTRAVTLDGEALCALGSLFSFQGMLEANDNGVMVNHTILIPKLLRYEYDLTLSPTASDGSFQVRGEDGTALINHQSFKRARTFSIKLLGDVLSVEGELYHTKGYTLHLNHVVIQRCQCKFLK